jgi:hydrogenase nickel incorporation protein HypA/HybF
MHELSVMQNILDIVVEFANKHKAKKVTAINLTVGDMSDLIPEWMQNYFDFVSKDTIADRAVLNIERIPAVLKCKSCGHEYVISRGNWQFICPKCESAEIELLSGREFTVKSIEIE